MLDILKEKFDNHVVPQEPKWFKEQREKNIDKIISSDFPSFRYGLNISFNPDFSFENIINIKKSNFVRNLVNNSEDVEILSFDKDFLDKFNEKTWHGTNEDIIFHFNNVFANDYLFIRIKENSVTKDLIVVDYSLLEGSLISNIFISVGKNSNSRILLKKSSQTGKEGYSSDTIKVLADDNSKLEIFSLQDLDQNIITFQNRNALLNKESTVKWTDFCIGGKFVKSNINSILEGENSVTENNAFFLSKKDQKYDLYNSCLHIGNNSKSNILTRGILGENSQVLTRGFIKIGKNAFNSNGYEKHDALLLDEQAESDAIPDLEINNNDVQCSHGATIGRIDKNVLFYLMSRGLSEKDAKREIVKGYFSKVLDKINEEEIKLKFYNKIGDMDL